MAALWEKEAKGVINLGQGHPGPSLLPLGKIQEAVNAAAAAPNANVFLMQYGATQGSNRFRTLICDWMARATERADAQPRPEHILATTGSGPALGVIAQLYTTPGDTIFVDGPAYMKAYNAFADARLNVMNVPTDEHGIRTDVIEQLIADGQRPALVYTVPIANNPTGVSMSEERKKRLVELSHKHGFKIASDEVYQFLCFDGKAPSSLFEYDDPANPSVFALNSFSKILGPGLRIGWMATHESHMKRVKQVGALQSGGGFNPFMGGVVCELLENGFVEEQAATLRRTYERNCRAMCDALDQFVAPALADGETFEYARPVGGFFVFMRLPQRFDARRLLQVATRHGVSFLEGHIFSADGQGYKNCLRVCFTFYEAEVLVDGIKRFATAVREYE